MRNNRILTLFDIDGTLVRGARCHYQAFVQAVKRFYGFEEDISGINYAGKTDPQILREVLDMASIKEDNQNRNFQDCLNFMTRYYQKNVHRENIQVLMGVKEILPELQKQGVLLGLATGNLEPIAHAKLGRVGLDDYFPFGGFGSDYQDRTLLIKKALERAQKYFNYNGKEIFVVGDTPRDVVAGREAGAKTIGVATGRYSVAELEDCGANFVFKDLTDKKSFMEDIGI
jgi:phosphoglycolate phosphatase